MVQADNTVIKMTKGASSVHRSNFDSNSFYYIDIENVQKAY